jgi:hypothetical protein
MPASACIAEQSKRRFADACTAKRHDKGSMCRRVQGERAGGQRRALPGRSRVHGPHRQEPRRWGLSLLLRIGGSSSRTSRRARRRLARQPTYRCSGTCQSERMSTRHFGNATTLGCRAGRCPAGPISVAAVMLGPETGAPSGAVCF